MFRVPYIKAKINKEPQRNAEVIKEKNEQETKHVIKESHLKGEPIAEQIEKDNQNEKTSELEDKAVASPRTLGDVVERSTSKAIERGMSEQLFFKP